MNASPSIALRFVGFTDHDQTEHFGNTAVPSSVASEKLYKFKGVVQMKHKFEYLYRKVTVGNLTNHQYVALMYWLEDEFLEVSFEAYYAPKNTRVKGNFPQRENQKKGFAPVGGTLYRNTADLLSAVAKVYDLAPDEPKTDKKKS